MLYIFLVLFFLSPTVSALHEAFYLFSGTPGKVYLVSPGKGKKKMITRVRKSLTYSNRTQKVGGMLVLLLHCHS